MWREVIIIWKIAEEVQASQHSDSCKRSGRTTEPREDVTQSRSRLDDLKLPGKCRCMRGEIEDEEESQSSGGVLLSLRNITTTERRQTENF